MVDARPVLLGMNNPQSAAAELALWPDPPGCAGHRLWSMLSERVRVSKMDYTRRFDRRNILNSTVWDERAAAAVAPALWAALAGRRVVVLGASARKALGLPSDVGILEWAERDGVLWCVASHPSGRSRHYNEPKARVAMALRLEALYMENRDG